METYLKTVTLGAFTWKDEGRISMFLACIKKAGAGWLVLHFLLITLCLNFPLMFSMARIAPHELYTRLLGVNLGGLSEILSGESGEITLESPESIDDFNNYMIASNYGTKVLLPLLGISLGLLLIIQAAFFLSAAFFLGLSRMNSAPLTFRERFGLSIYSSTLPVIAATLMGLALPTVHIIVFYFIVIFIIFQRSRLCPNG